MDSEEEVVYIEEHLEDCTQRFYVGGTITFATHPDQTALITEVDVAGNSITTTNDVDGEVEWEISQSDLRVLSIPDNVDDNTNDKIAPFTIEDIYGEKEDTKYWTYADAYAAAEEYAEENECDCYVHNAWGNECGVMVEWIPDEEEEYEEEEESDADETPL